MKWKEFNLVEFHSRTKGKIGLLDEVETIESENPNKIREGKMIVDYVPIRDKVLVLAVWKLSPITLTNKAQVQKEEPSFKMVVAYGDETHSIKIGDIVQINFNATIQPIQIKENALELSKMIEMYGNPTLKLPVAQEIQSVYVTAYYTVPFYAIDGIFEDGNYEV